MHKSIRSFVRLTKGIAACGVAVFGFCASAQAAEEPAHSPELDAMIIAQAKRHGVPEKLVRRIVMRESRYNPRARNHSFWGLMQISYPTAKSMGFKGSPQDLLNPLVNLTYAVPYLANAFVIAGKQEDAAVRLYAAGYYDTARTRGLLGVLRTANSDPILGVGAPSDQPPIMATAYDTTNPAAVPVSIAAAPNGRASDDGVDMVTDKSGNPAPPKKWLHDGGTSVIARGEQGIEKVAAYEQANGIKPDEQRPSTEHKRSARSHVQKNVTFASIDAPPADAQAYAASAGQQGQAASSDSQAAIAQATAGRTDAQPPVAEPNADVDAPAKKRPIRSAHKHTPKTETTKIAKSEPSDAPSAHEIKKKRAAVMPKKADAVALRQTGEGQ